jgi:tryptophanyl-tRNA synthetase
MTKTPRYLSGIQASGILHLGNYFGAIKQHIENQFAGNSFYFIANYHALTTIQDAETMRRLTHGVATTYLALGLDPDIATLYRQSDIPEVTELTWLLMTVTPMGLLERAVSYKDKVAHGIAASVGLFGYPALMASDILAFDSHVVPVGSDQVQHVEMTRDMAQAFNRTYDSEVFVVPEAKLNEAATVPGLDGAKMSKSYGNTIPIFAEGKPLKKLVMSIKTDSTPVEDPKDPDACLVFTLFSLFATEDEKAEMRARYVAGGLGYGDAKKALLGKINEAFGPVRDRKKALDADPDYVADVLREGAKKARAVARAVTDRAREACGVA